MLRRTFPSLYLPDEAPFDDPRKRRRVMPMKVICLGLARTGCTSMAHALEELGFTVYNGFRPFSNSGDSKMFQQAFDAKYNGKGKVFGRKEFDMWFGHASAITSMNAYMHVEELAAAYPDAKFVLMQREIDSWTKSIHHMFDTATEYPALSSHVWSLIDAPNSSVQPLVWRVRQFFSYPSPFTRDPAERYHAHVRLVRRQIQRDQLLEWKVQQGWEPLCRFLGLDVPKTEFPHVNKGNDLKERFAEMRLARKRVRQRRLGALALGLATFVVLLIVSMLERE